MKKPVLTLTPAACARVKQVLANAPAGVVGLRVRVTQKGCSGLMYKVDYLTTLDPKDIKIEQGTTTIYLDPAASLYLIGSTMDYVEEKLSARFVFNNPNAKDACGCGESFKV